MSLLVSSDPAVGFDKVLDEMATLTIWQGEEIKRRVRGIVTFCEQGEHRQTSDPVPHDHPPLFLAQLTAQNCRSFQNLNIVAILAILC